MAETSKTDNAERGYTLTRVFDAPRELVWKAWTEADQFAQWFGGPGTEWENLTMDARPGGTWGGIMVVPDGPRLPWSFRFEELDHPARLVVAVVDEPVLGDEFDLLTVTFKDVGGKTEMVLRQSGGHLTDEQYQQAKEGTASFLDRMAELVQKG